MRACGDSLENHKNAKCLHHAMWGWYQADDASHDGNGDRDRDRDRDWGWDGDWGDIGSLVARHIY